MTDEEREYMAEIRRAKAVRRQMEARHRRFCRWKAERDAAESAAIAEVASWTVERAANAVIALRNRGWLRGEPPRKRSEWAGAFCLLIVAADGLTNIPKLEQ
jgi:hypothetical protein